MHKLIYADKILEFRLSWINGSPEIVHTNLEVDFVFSSWILNRENNYSKITLYELCPLISILTKLFFRTEQKWQNS